MKVVDNRKGDEGVVTSETSVPGRFGNVATDEVICIQANEPPFQLGFPNLETRMALKPTTGNAAEDDV